MDRSWSEVFRPRFGRAERSLVNELIDIWNRCAHQGHFSADDAYRALDTSGRLLAAISAPEANDVETMKKELRRLHFDEEAGNENQLPTAAIIQSLALEDFRLPHETSNSRSPVRPIDAISVRPIGFVSSSSIALSLPQGRLATRRSPFALVTYTRRWV